MPIAPVEMGPLAAEANDGGLAMENDCRSPDAALSNQWRNSRFDLQWALLAVAVMDATTSPVESRMPLFGSRWPAPASHPCGIRRTQAC